MQTEFYLNLSSMDHDVTVMVTGTAPFASEFSNLIDILVQSTSQVVSTQGLSELDLVASFLVEAVNVSDFGSSREYVIRARSVHPSVWRILTGLFLTFDIASTPLGKLRIIGTEKGAILLSASDILSISYPRLRESLGFIVERDNGSGHSRSVEVDVLSNARNSDVQTIISALNAWLQVCSGGLFNDGEHPITNAHDCPAFANLGSRLLVARFDLYSGSESAFDVVLNQLDFLNRQFKCINAVRLY